MFNLLVSTSTLRNLTMPFLISKMLFFLTKCYLQWKSWPQNYFHFPIELIAIHPLSSSEVTPSSHLRKFIRVTFGSFSVQSFNSQDYATIALRVFVYSICSLEDVLHDLNTVQWRAFLESWDYNRAKCEEVCSDSETQWNLSVSLRVFLLPIPR